MGAVKLTRMTRQPTPLEVRKINARKCGPKPLANFAPLPKVSIPVVHSFYPADYS